MTNLVTFVVYGAVFSTAPWLYKRFTNRTTNLNQMKNGFQLVQAVRDIAHVLSITAVFFSRHYLIIPELALLYLCMDVSLHSRVSGQPYVPGASRSLQACSSVPSFIRIHCRLSPASSWHWVRAADQFAALTDPSSTTQDLHAAAPSLVFHLACLRTQRVASSRANVTAYIILCPLLMHNSNVFRKQCLKAWHLHHMSSHLKNVRSF